MHYHLSEFGEGGCGEEKGIFYMELHFLVTKKFARYCGKKVIAVHIILYPSVYIIALSSPTCSVIQQPIKLSSLKTAQVLFTQVRNRIKEGKSFNTITVASTARSPACSNGNSINTVEQLKIASS